MYERVGVHKLDMKVTVHLREALTVSTSSNLSEGTWKHDSFVKELIASSATAAMSSKNSETEALVSLLPSAINREDSRAQGRRGAEVRLFSQTTLATSLHTCFTPQHFLYSGRKSALLTYLGL